ncbi:BON domain-containing protein [Mucilaginibacter puniceus]
MKTDSKIQQDVIDELQWEPILNAAEIGVTVHNGVVTLSGYVSNYGKKFAAEKATWRVKGVKAVAEELEVRLAKSDKLTDSEIAESIVRTLKSHTSIPDERIKIKVTDGSVTVEGEVDWNYQKESAINSIRHLKGVKWINNFITVKPLINTTIVKDNIRKALERRADFEAAKIKVETIGNKVILNGTAKSWVERCAVENAVWGSPGVTTVDDQLVIV